MLALSGTLAALMMAGLDQTIVATAGPEIQRDLMIPASLYPWITTAYLVASTVMLPIYGKLSDVLGRKPVLIVGVMLFLLGSLLCGLAPTTGLLIAARAVQGLGAASLFTTTLAVIADLFPPNERGKYMGLIGAVMGISSVAGPIAGGIITDLMGWHWVFFINLPVGLGALWLIVTKMPRLGGRGARPVRIDVAGALWLLATVVPLLLALSLGRAEATPADGWSWTSPTILGMFGAAAGALVAFLLTERRAADPILDLSLFRSRTIGRATLTMFVLGSTFLFSIVFLPLYLVNVLGISAARAGLSLTPLTLAMVLTSVLSGHAASRFGHVKWQLVGSLAVLATAFALMGFTLTPESTLAGVTLKMILIGLGMGPTMPLYLLIVQNASRPEDVGVVTAGSVFSRAMGQVIGLALFGTLFAATLTGSLSAGTASVMGDVPPEARALLAGAMPEVIGGGESIGIRFEADSARARIVAAAGAATDPAASQSGVNGEVTLPGASRAVALEVVDEMEAIYDESLTEATTRLFRIGVVLVLISLVLTAAIPEEGGRGANT